MLYFSHALLPSWHIAYIPHFSHASLLIAPLSSCPIVPLLSYSHVPLPSCLILPTHLIAHTSIALMPQCPHTSLSACLIVCMPHYPQVLLPTCPIAFMPDWLLPSCLTAHMPHCPQASLPIYPKHCHHAPFPYVSFPTNPIDHKSLCPRTLMSQCLHAPLPQASLPTYFLLLSSIDMAHCLYTLLLSCPTAQLLFYCPHKLRKEVTVLFIILLRLVITINKVGSIEFLFVFHWFENCFCNQSFCFKFFQSKFCSTEHSVWFS